MDPLTLGIGAVGLGLKLFGSFSGASDTSKYQSQINSIEQQKFGVENQVNDQRQVAMNLSARRQQLEDFRNTQRARAQGLNAATQQGAQFGSGLAGGQAATQSQGLFNVQGVNQQQQIGNNIFGLDRQITGFNAQESTIKSNMNSDLAKDQGWASLGGSILSSTGTLGAIGKSAGGMFGNMGNSFFGGGSPSGY